MRLASDSSPKPINDVDLVISSISRTALSAMCSSEQTGDKSHTSRSVLLVVAVKLLKSDNFE